MPLLAPEDSADGSLSALVRAVRARLPFKHLRTRLTVLYATLFAAAMILVSFSVFTAISRVAERQIRDELTAAGTVFDRVWSLRSERLHEGVSLLSRDFGFREAVATGDSATIVSAMENMKRRFNIDQAFILGVDGRIIGAGAGALSADAGKLTDAFLSADDPQGVVMLGGRPVQIISAPVLSPDLIGWLTFAVQLDQNEMRALERLSAIPLKAEVMHREGRGWRLQGASTARERDVFSAFIDQMLTTKTTAPALLDEPSGRSVALVKHLPALTQDAPAVLLLRYPLALALAPYRPLLALVLVAALAGLAVVGWGSWALAKGITRPLSDLDHAANLLQDGQDAHVRIETQDEIGRLAASFNAMATSIRERERRITHLALHDAETGLPNRLALERTAEARGELQAGQVYMAALGLQRFDHVRGAIGYALAAEAVKMIGARIGELAPASSVAKIADDVLGFTLVGMDPLTLAEDAARLMAQLELPLKVGGDAIDVALNLGLAPLPQGAAPGEVIQRASIALDQARKSRRKVAVFDAEAYGDPASNLSLMSSMLAALESGDIELYYQPKLDMRLRTITSAEALIRWRHPTRGMLPPDLFIPMAEETNHIRALTEWIIKRAIADQADFARAGHDLEISVNISGRTLSEADFTQFVLDHAAEAKGGLVLEITETAVIEHPEVALAMLDTFAAAGIGISIDDFGTGLSSLAYLKRIPSRELKMDKSIVEGVTENQRDALIVRSTIELAHSLGLKVTAEGIETSDCFSLLQTMGCDLAQGYLISRPLPCKDLLAFLDADRLADATLERAAG